jgi:AcrR family transcriptional regulator
MARKRLTREESRDLTRQRLLEAAAVIIARKGLSGASVEDIAAHAGYTRGAFHSNFRSKADLFIELLKRDHQDVQQELQRILGAGLSREDMQRQLQMFYGQLYRGNISYVLWAEARLQALRDARFRARLSALLLEKRDMIAYFITQFGKVLQTSGAGAGRRSGVRHDGADRRHALLQCLHARGAARGQRAGSAGRCVQCDILRLRRYRASAPWRWSWC